MNVCLCDHVVLNVPLPEDQLTLHTDASGRGVGAILNVYRDGEEKPTAFFSRHLQGPEHRYSATELEALAIHSSCFNSCHICTAENLK